MAALLPGRPYPLGATVAGGGVNFSIFSARATAVELLLYDRPEDVAPARTIRLDPEANRTYYYWHVFVPGLRAGQVYAYRVSGPYAPEVGLRFDRSKVLIDPYARALYYDSYWREAAKRYGDDNGAYAMKSVVVDPTTYDWEGDAPLRRTFDNSVIYELHVRGFTANPNSGVARHKLGTYAGLIEKIPYLQELGIRTVELMPVHQFDPQAAPTNLPNYWGYEPLAWLAPHRDYSSRQDPLGPVDEFRDMVKALHRAGIAVILDVVYNHTAEDDESGPTLCLRGLANDSYYILDPQDLSRYRNYSGTGNTINGNHSIVRRLIMHSLRYWVEHMHVDGFRFDLASILSRGEDGEPLVNPPILWSIESSPELAASQLIAEAWDAGGLYQVNNFVGDRWAVWNGRYRDAVRRFVKGDPGTVHELGDVIGGSPSLFAAPDRDPTRSINMVTAHDGFTLRDLVSYDVKHNWANGQHNTDGTNDNFSWNCGVEGPTDDLGIETLRKRQMRNLLTILLMSQGRPLLLMGDEVSRTQGGNNNAFDQDSEISWFDWDDVTRHADLLRFTRLLVATYQRSAAFRDRRFWFRPGETDVVWHGVRLNQPDWGHDSHTLAYEIENKTHGEHFYVMLNAYWEPLEFELPPMPPGQTWCRLVDTALPAPADITETPPPLAPRQRTYVLVPRAAVVLTAAAKVPAGARATRPTRG